MGTFGNITSDSRQCAFPGGSTDIQTMALGGTGANLTAIAGGLVYSTATQLAITSALTGIVQGNGAAAPTAFTGTQYGLVYFATASTGGSTAAGTSVEVLHGNATGAPTWGSVALTTDVSGTLPVGNGGSGATTLTGVLYGNGAAAFTASVGTANYLPKWSATAPYLTGTSLIFDNGTNVGIGTSGPGNKLTVQTVATGVITSTYGASSENDSTATADNLETVGFFSTVRARGSVNQTDTTKNVASIIANAFSYNTATVTVLSGVRLDVRNLNTGIVSNARGFWVNTIANSGGGTITTTEGLRVEDQTVGTNNRGVSLAISSGANKHNVYAVGTADNYFNGNVGINTLVFGTSAAKTLAIGNGTAPSTSPADVVQMWSADRGGTAGKASLHLRTEDGTSHVFGDLVGIGTVTPNLRFSQKLDVSASGAYGGVGLNTWSAASSDSSSILDFNRSKSSTIGTHTIVASSDILGYLMFRGSDGVAFITSSYIRSVVDGTPGVNDMPGRLEFATTPDGSAASAVRMMINNAGNVLIGTGTIDAAAKLQIESTTQGILPPRMTKAQRDAIGTPANGLMLYQTDGTAGVKAYVGGAWVTLNTTADP